MQELAPFSYVEINGLKIPSPQHAYVVLWEAISGSKGCSAKTALRGLEAHFGRKTTGGVRGPRGHTLCVLYMFTFRSWADQEASVVLMDELDQLLTTKQDVVYNFFNWPTMRDSQLFVIAVANRMDLPQHLAAKIKSRLGELYLRKISSAAMLIRRHHRSPDTTFPALRQNFPHRDRSISFNSSS